MNIIHTLKSLPVIGLITLGLVLSSNTAMADKAGHDGTKGQIAQQFSHELDKSYGRKHKHAKRHKEQRYDRGRYSYGHSKHSHKHHGRHHGHKHKSHRAHGHGDYHQHGYRGHSHSHSTHNHAGHRHHYVDFDDLHFMVGLHTDRFDIILRD